MIADEQQPTVIVPEPEDTGRRLDAVLAAHVDDFSRNRLQALIRAGQVQIGQRTVLEPKYRVSAGDTITLIVPEPEAAEPQPEDIPLTIVYEDDDLIVIDKPAGLVVHPGAGNPTGTLVNALIHHCGTSLSGIGGVKRPGIVHRIDKDTTGLLVVAKNDMHIRALPPSLQTTAKPDHWNAPIKPLSGALPQPSKAR